jgi:hypothetical protein
MVKPELTPSSHDAKDLVGTWTLVSVVAERDGRKFDSMAQMQKVCWCSIQTGSIR